MVAARPRHHASCTSKPASDGAAGRSPRIDSKLFALRCNALTARRLSLHTGTSRKCESSFKYPGPEPSLNGCPARVSYGSADGQAVPAPPASSSARRSPAEPRPSSPASPSPPSATAPRCAACWPSSARPPTATPSSAGAAFQPEPPDHADDRPGRALPALPPPPPMPPYYPRCPHPASRRRRSGAS